jgi:predicted DCC family thiol-disulfide oxidoreductase YuxK
MSRQDAARTEGKWSWRADAAVPPFPDEQALLVFDGECVLCSANAAFVLKHDRRLRFRLTAAQGELGQALYRHFGLSTLDYESLLLVQNGVMRRDSDAVLAMLVELGWPWRALGIARLMPPPLRDGLYRLIARNRYRLFGKRESCWVPDAHVRDRVI